MANGGADNGLNANAVVDNLHLLVFEKYYPRMTSMPVDAMLPTLVSKRMLRDDMLRGRIQNAPSNPDKARLLLEPVYVSLKTPSTDLFMSLLDAMTIYAKGSDDQEVTRLVSDIKKELSPQQEVNMQNHPGKGEWYD